MTMYGADVAELRALAAQFDRVAQQLDANRMSVGNAIQLSAWMGPFATQFRIQWNSEHSVRVHSAAELLRAGAQTLRRNADDQERVSASVGDGDVLRPPLSPRFGQPEFQSFLDDVGAGIRGTIDVFEIAGNIKDVMETVRGNGEDILVNLPAGKYLSLALKGVGLGSAAAGVAESINKQDWSGALASVADAGFTFATAPVSVLWQGLKAETALFVPLDSSSQDEHLAWMSQQGYSADEIADRYAGVQGFINLGNDNVERKAPWLNRIADSVMEKPAEWLYNVGIRLG